MIRIFKNWMMKCMGLPTCEEIVRFSYAYLEEKLESEVKERFEEHLQGCTDCYKFVESYREIAQPDKLQQKIPLDPDFQRKVAQFLEKNCR